MSDSKKGSSKLQGGLSSFLAQAKRQEAHREEEPKQDEAAPAPQASSNVVQLHTEEPVAPPQPSGSIRTALTTATPALDAEPRVVIADPQSSTKVSVEPREAERPRSERLPLSDGAAQHWFGTIEKPYERVRDGASTRKRAFVLPIELIERLEAFCLRPKRSPNTFVERLLRDSLQGRSITLSDGLVARLRDESAKLRVSESALVELAVREKLDRLPR